MINLSKCQFVKSAPGKKDFLLDRKQVVFLGKSNVGKSSLVNAVLNQKIALTSKTPGRTQMLSYIDLDGKYYLVDAPGYGYFHDSSLDFAPLMNDYLSSGKKIIRRAYLLLDGRREIDQDDMDVYRALKAAEISVRPVITKVDKLNTSEKARLVNRIGEAFPGVGVLFTSAEKKTGLEQLRRDVSDALE
jgi:GTP-binding protein